MQKTASSNCPTIRGQTKLFNVFKFDMLALYVSIRYKQDFNAQVSKFTFESL